MKMNIQEYGDRYKQTTTERDELLAVYNQQKKENQFTDALETLDRLFNNCYDKDIEHYVPHVYINKEYSIIYRKLKDKKQTEHYKCLSEIGEMLNSSTRRTLRYILDSYYFTDEFRFKDEAYDKARAKYIEWFKPISEEMFQALNEVKVEYDRDYLNYSYVSSRALDVFFHSKNEKLQALFKKIDATPFVSFIE